MLQGPLEVNGGANGSQRWQSSGLQRRMAEACYKVTHASHVLDNTSLILGRKNKAVHVWFLPQTVLLRTVQMTLTFVHLYSVAEATSIIDCCMWIRLTSCYHHWANITFSSCCKVSQSVVVYTFSWHTNHPWFDPGKTHKSLVILVIKGAAESSFFIWK